MRRTRRQSTLIDHVQVAMSVRDERRTAASNRTPAGRGRRRDANEQLARWENEGGYTRRDAGTATRG